MSKNLPLFRKNNVPQLEPDAIVFTEKGIAAVEEKNNTTGRGNDEAVIQIRNVVKSYDTPTGQFIALKGVDMDFRRAEFVGVTGKSGSGKSTLVNMISGIDRPTSGSICVMDTFTHTMDESQMSRWRGRNLGIVFQFYQLLPTLSLLENVLLPMDFAAVIPNNLRSQRAMELLDMVGLADKADKMPASVSGGQQQAAAIARALANDPQFILADEPTGNLDSKMAESIFALFDRLRQQGKTVIMVTHDPVLASRTSRQVVLADGEIINEWVLRVLPALPHKLMLKATHELQTRTYSPGSVIIQEGAQVNNLEIITSGQVEIATSRGSGHEKILARLKAGDHVGEVELLSGEPAIATVRTMPTTIVNTLVISRQAFNELIAAAQMFRDNLTMVASLRQAQNRAAMGI